MQENILLLLVDDYQCENQNDNSNDYLFRLYGNVGTLCHRIYRIDGRAGKCPIHVVTFTLISILVTDYIKKRIGQAGTYLQLPLQWGAGNAYLLVLFS